jgi:D-alanyl-D-alanine carboxypeptidase (penicillin-binding protein 5/6)
VKKIIVILAAVILVLYSILPVCAAATSPPVVESEAAVLMDAKTGQVLFQKNMEEQLYPASITKIMTVLLGLENGNLNDIITMSREAIFSIGRGSAHIALDVGEQITLEQALMAAMLPSANEASNGIAEYVSGSIPEFVKLMKQRAVQAGALHTSFTNANGLWSADHVTTAYDMAMITKSALMNDQFCRIFGTLKYDIPPTNKQPQPRHLYAEHKMLPNGRYAYDGIIGGKTGYTQMSQNTLVTAASRGDRELIVVVLKSQNNAVYTDTKTLLDYGFNAFKEVPIMLPAVTADNLANPQNNLKAVNNIITPVKDAKYTRLLLNNIDSNDIVVDYAVLNGADGKNVTLQMNMHLKNPSNLMYEKLGSITLTAPLASPSWPGILLKIVIFIMKIIAAIALGLFALRWFFTFRRKIRKKYRAFKGSRTRSISVNYNETEG